MTRQKIMKIVFLLLVVGISGLAIYYSYILIKRYVMSYELQFKLVLKSIVKKYGIAIAENVEKIFRLETANFTSGQFKGTLSPGMEKASDVYPFGWKSLADTIWKEKPDFAPKKFLPFTENATGKTKYFLKFPSLEASAMTLAQFLKNNENNAGRWFSTNDKAQLSYVKKLSYVNTPILTSIS